MRKFAIVILIIMVLSFVNYLFEWWSIYRYVIFDYPECIWTRDVVTCKILMDEHER